MCAGITKTARFYELRVGPNITRQTTYHSSGLGVWFRGEPVFDGDGFDINVDHLASAETEEQPCVSSPEPVEAEPESTDAESTDAEKPKMIGPFKFKPTKK